MEENRNTKPVYCPRCKMFMFDCIPDHEEWSEPCDSFREEKTEEQYREELDLFLQAIGIPTADDFQRMEKEHLEWKERRSI